MQRDYHEEATYYPHISVDCVLMGIDNDKLCVLLVERKNAGTGKTEFKLPGSLIYKQEDLDEAASRVLTETTGLKRVSLKQFRAFGSPTRTSNQEDVLWLERASNLKIDRIVTIAYLALCKVRKTNPDTTLGATQWTPIDALPTLPFDHKEIIGEATQEIGRWIEAEPSIVFDYLPTLFTASQVRRTYEIIYNKTYDVRNFHKRLNAFPYVVQTDKKETGVAHRSARYYRFDRIKYNKLRTLNKS